MQRRKASIQLRCSKRGWRPTCSTWRARCRARRTPLRLALPASAAKRLLATPDTETTFDELKGRIAKVIAYVEGFTEEQINASEGRSITIPTRGEPHVFKNGGDYLTQFAIPNFFFHVTTAYGLVRQQGVEIGKMTYLAGA